MRGGFVHNRVLIAPMDDYFQKRGGLVCLEYPTGPGRRAGFVDLFARLGSWRFACEAELTPARVAHDLAKAIAVQAHCLLIVVPERRTMHAVQRHLEALEIPSTLRIEVGPPAVLQQRVNLLLGIKDAHECPSDLKH